MYAGMKKLIAKRYYADRRDVSLRLAAFLRAGRLTDAQYAELCALADAVYGQVSG